MSQPARVEIEKFATEAFAVARDRILREYAEKQRSVQAQVERTHNSGGYLPALAKWGAERLREMILANADAYVEAFTLYGVPSDRQAEQDLQTAAQQMAEGTISDIRGDLQQRSVRLRIPEEGRGVPWHLGIERAMHAAVKEGLLRLKRQRIKATATQTQPAPRPRAQSASPTHAEAVENQQRQIRAALKRARLHRESLQRIEDTLRPMVPGVGKLRDKPFWLHLWAYLRQPSVYGMQKPEFMDLTPEDIYALLSGGADALPEGGAGTEPRLAVPADKKAGQPEATKGAAKVTASESNPDTARKVRVGLRPPRRTPDLQVSRERIDLVTVLARELVTIKQELDGYCTAESLKQKHPEFVLWKHIGEIELKELVQGSAFTPKAYAESLTLREYGITSRETLRKDRKKLLRSQRDKQV